MPRKKFNTAPKLCILMRNENFFTSTDYEYAIINEFQFMAASWKYNVSLIFITDTDMAETDYDTYMQSGHYIGAFFIGFSKKDIWVTQLENTSFPTVLLDCLAPAGPYVTCIGSDYILGMDLAVSHLAALGHTKIAFINDSENMEVNSYRKEGYLCGLKKNGLPFSRKLYFSLSENRNALPAPFSGYIKPAVTKIVKAGATAIICGSDTIASAVMDGCRALGCQIPQDISIIGCHSLSLCERLNPPLTSIDVERAALGYFAFTSLRELFRGMPLQSVKLRPRLSLRKSTAAPCRDNTIL